MMSVSGAHPGLLCGSMLSTGAEVSLERAAQFKNRDREVVADYRSLAVTGHAGGAAEA
jgi:hypothetical protein